jgi:hypothetical protein
MIAGTLEVQMLANLARLQGDMTSAKRMVGGAMKGIESSVAMAKRALGALGIGIGLIGFGRMIKGAIDAQDELSKLSQKINVSVETLAGLRHAADLAGVSGEALTKGFKTLSSQMFDASMGLAESKRNFAALGVQVKNTDGTLKDTQAVMLAVADKFAKMNDGAAKSALAVKLFGKAGLDMIPMLNSGSAAIAEMIAEGQRLNPVTTESARQAEIFNDNMKRLSGSISAVGISILNDLLPQLSEMTEQMELARKSGEGFWSTMFEGAKAAMQGVMGWTAAGQLQKITDDIEDAYENLRAIQARNAANQSAVNEAVINAIKDQISNMVVERTKMLDMIAVVNALGGGKPRSTLSPTIVDDAALKKQQSAADAALKSYESMIKALEQKLLLEKDSTEVEKLMFNLERMRTDQYKHLTVAQLENLKATAQAVDLKNADEAALKAYVKAEEEWMVVMNEVNDLMAARSKAQGDAELAMEKQIEQMQFETKLIGMTNKEREIAIFLRQAETAKISEGAIARGKEAIAAKNAAEEINRSQVSFWQSVESAGHQAFLSIFDTSKSVLERIRDMLKTHLIDILYQLTAKKWIFNIIASISGAGVAQQAIGSVGDVLSTAGGIGNLFSGGSNLLTMLGGGSGYMAGVSGAAIAESTFSGVGLTLGETAGVAMAETFGAGIATAIPYVGWALAAYGILKSMGVFGSGTYAQGTGYRLTGNIGRSGFSGATAFALAENDGTQYQDLIPESNPIYAKQARDIQAAMVPVFMDFKRAADLLGADSSMLTNMTHAVDVFVGMGDTATVNAGLTAAAISQLVDQVATELIPNINDFKTESETLGQTFLRLIGEVKVVRDMFEVLGIGLAATVEISGRITTAFGGAGNLQSQFKSYYDNFYTQAEKNAIITKQVAAEFAAMNRSVPETREEFKLLVAGLDLTTTAGIEMFKSLMNVQGAFATIFPEIIDSMASLDEARANVWRAYDTEADKLRNLAEQMGGFGKSLHDLQASLLIGTLSPLGPMEQLAEAQRQFRDIASKARLGDAEALAALSGASQAYLTTGRGAYASGTGYNVVFAEVQAALTAAGDTATRAAANATSQISLLQQQVEELVGIRAGVQTLAEAMAIFTNIPGHAGGGIASGWSMVGERGPELVNFTSPGRVYSSADTGSMLSNKELIDEIKALRVEVEALRADTRIGDTANVRATNASGDKIAKATLEVDYRQNIRPAKAA